MSDHYRYACDVGIFTIKADTDQRRYWLEIDGTPLASFALPELAAKAVRRHETGWRPWDELKGRADGPARLSDWTRG